MIARSVRLRYLVRERDVRGGADREVLSVYRDHGVVPKASRDDNFNKTPQDLSMYKHVQRGDLVLNKMKAWQGSLGVSDFDGVVSGDYLVCELTDGAVDERYLHQVLRSAPMIDEYGKRSTGIRPSQWRLYWDDFADIPIELPRLEEQRAIADYLDTETDRIDALITKKQRLCVLIRERIRSARARLVLGLDASEARAEDLVLGEHAASFRPTRLRFLTPRIGVGVVVNPSSYFTDDPDGVPFIHGSDVKEGFVDTTNIKRLSSADNDALWRSKLCEGDLVVVRAGYPGRAAVVPPELDGANCASILIVRRSPDVLPKFLETFFNSSVAGTQIGAAQYGAAQEQVNVGHLVDFVVPIPDKAQQRSIVDEVVELDDWASTATDQLGCQIELLRERRRALVTAAVTGEFRVPGVV